MANILVVEDDQSILEALVYLLEGHGHEVRGATSGENALRQFVEKQPDLIVLDIMLGRLDGFGVAQRIRATASTPIIMLTALGDETSILRGFSVGADDYVVKPFRPSELVARVHALLRRATGIDPRDGRVVRANELELFLDKCLVLRRGQAVQLSPTEMDILFYLAIHHDRVIYPQELAERVWHYTCTEQEASHLVKSAISRLRDKIEDDREKPSYIVTVRGKGYRFGC